MKQSKNIGIIILIPCQFSFNSNCLKEEMVDILTKGQLHQLLHSWDWLVACNDVRNILLRIFFSGDSKYIYTWDFLNQLGKCWLLQFCPFLAPFYNNNNIDDNNNSNTNNNNNNHNMFLYSIFKNTLDKHKKLRKTILQNKQSSTADVFRPGNNRSEDGSKHAYFLS